MLVETIIGLLNSIIRPIINLIPSLPTLSIPSYISGYILGIFRTASVFIPFGSLLPLLSFIILMYCWRFTLAIINRVRSLLF